MKKGLMNFKQFCDYIGVNSRTGGKILNQGKIPYTRINSHRRYVKTEDVDMWLEKNIVQPQNQ